MEYQIQNVDQIIDHWVRVFEALSLKQFENFVGRLEFPASISAELSGVAKAFSLSVLTYLGRSMSEESFIPMFTQSEVDPLVQIWNNTFSQLKSIDAADTVYSWGQKAYQIHINAHLSAISEWDILLTDWALDPNDPKWLPLKLSFGTIAKIQSAVIQYEISGQRMRFEIRQAEEKPSDAWEGYAFNTLHIGAWLDTTGQAMIRLAKWSAIFVVLQSDELEIFDRWGYDTFTRYDVRNYFSIAEFANSLS